MSIAVYTYNRIRGLYLEMALFSYPGIETAGRADTLAARKLRHHRLPQSGLGANNAEAPD
jgi:hypothetical protein